MLFFVLEAIVQHLVDVLGIYCMYYFSIFSLLCNVPTLYLLPTYIIILFFFISYTSYIYQLLSRYVYLFCFFRKGLLSNLDVLIRNMDECYEKELIITRTTKVCNFKYEEKMIFGVYMLIFMNFSALGQPMAMAPMTAKSHI